MSDSPPLPAPALRYQRERTIVALCDHFAQDRLEVGELEQLIDRAHKATTLAELESLVAGLPEATVTDVAVPSRSFHIASPGETPDQQVVVALMSGNVRKGTWTAARKIHTIAMMGGAQLDFRQARLSPGVTEVYCFAAWGGVEIIVPPGLRVESNGIGIMGGFEHSGGEEVAPDMDAPILRITGLAIMGGVEISQREVGESARDARKRLR
ncbi:DUF1707 domain-containing protein [soil metagenome]